MCTFNVRKHMCPRYNVFTTEWSNSPPLFSIRIKKYRLRFIVFRVSRTARRFRAGTPVDSNARGTYKILPRAPHDLDGDTNAPHGIVFPKPPRTPTPIRRNSPNLNPRSCSYVFAENGVAELNTVEPSSRRVRFGNEQQGYSKCQLTIVVGVHSFHVAHAG